MATEQATTIQLQSGGGAMQCQLRLPSGTGKTGAVIVVPEAFGVTKGIVEECDRLAAAGHIALGIEIYHRSAPAGWVPAKFDFTEAGPHFKALTNDGLAEDLSAARDFLATHERANGKIAALGFCVGGFAAYLGACRTNLAASVVYYGGGLVHARPQMTQLQPLLGEKVTCPVLGLFGANDTSISEADRSAIDAALVAQNVEHQIIVYPGAGHAFANPERASYNKEASEKAWDEVTRFLSARLGEGFRPGPRRR